MRLRDRVSEFVVICSRFILALVLALSGAGKIFAGGKATSLLSSVSSVPLSLASQIIMTLSIVELVTGVMLVVSKKRLLLWSTMTASLLMLGFFILALIPAASGSDCGCFGEIIPSRIDTAMVIRNSVLLVMSMISLSIISHNKGYNASKDANIK